jgi:hypothetical protein
VKVFVGSSTNLVFAGDGQGKKIISASSIPSGMRGRKVIKAIAMGIITLSVYNITSGS